MKYLFVAFVVFGSTIPAIAHLGPNIPATGAGSSQTVMAIHRLELALNRSLTPQERQAITEQAIRLATISKNQVASAHSDNTYQVREFLACVHGKGGLLIGELSGFVCYNWSSGDIYLLGKLGAIASGAAGGGGGVGLLILSRKEGESAEGTYFCGGGSYVSIIGGTGLYCGNSDNRSSSQILFGGAMVGALIEGGIGMLTLVRM